MALWRRRRRRAEPYAAVTDEERISRYLYLLGTLPPSVVENAHRTAFAELPPEKRREMFDELRPFMSPEEQREAPEPSLLARVMGRAQANGSTTTAVLDREATQAGTRPDAGDQPLGFLFRNPVLVGLVAYQFLASQSLVAYFTVGAGSIGISGEPGWVGELGGVSPADGAMGVDGAGFDGGGFDGGGFGGGFDGGGFGGGFGGGDGGGGF